MNIGFYFGNLNPNAGGGFTFLDDILLGLCNYNGKHNIYLFYQNEKEINIDYKNITLINISENYINYLRLITALRIKKKILSKLKSILVLLNKRIYQYIDNKEKNTTKRIDELKESKFNKSLKKNNIHLLWFFVPTKIDICIPFVFTVWDLGHQTIPYFPEVSQNDEWESREATYSFMIPRSSLSITGNKTGKDEIELYYKTSADKIKIIPFATPSFTLKQNLICIEPKVKLPDEYIFYPANFWAHKNHIAILHAVKILKEKHNMNIKVIFTGGDFGNLNYIKQETAWLGLNDNIIFLGFVERGELIYIYKNALALIYMSLLGPNNIPPLEAFALGCPVIASKIKGHEEQLKDCALLVDPTNEVEIASGIKQIYKNESLRKKLIAKGLKKAKEWTTDDYLKRVFEIIDEFEVIKRCWK